MLDYWRNEDKDIVLGMRPEDGSFWFNSEWDNDPCWNRVSTQDLKNLRGSIDLVLGFDARSN